ncbi:MAG: hypothetical protein ABSE73_08430 [Planctomycetota bacterium]
MKTCQEKAREYVHMAAAGGAVLAPIPVPGMGTTGLVVLEATLIYWIAKIYGETLEAKAIALVAATLEVGSLGVKVVVLEGLNFIPVAGWILKAPVAAGIIEGLGDLAIRHFEDKYPGKLYTVDPEVEKETRKGK